MDFDYQQIKDSEMRLPAPQSEQPPAKQIPPVKPRRSIKSRATPKEEAPPGPPTNGREVEAKKEAVIQRVSPAVLRCGGPGPSPGPLEALSPSLRAHTLLWFERSQLPRLRRPGQPLPRWLHGFATRREAEELLKDEPEGCFLVRLSESKIGFVLSYRGRDRCRHFILEEEDRAPEGGRHYLIAGEESRHGSLQELINYYTQHPVGPFHEVLTVPCVKGKRGSEDLAGQGAGGAGGGAPGAEQESSTVQSAPVLPELPPKPPGSPGPPGLPEMAQYAVVRKPMRKANSLPDRQTDEETEQVPNFIPVDPPKSTPPAESDQAGAEPGDPQYARVNKPHRALASTAARSSSPSPSPSSSSSSSWADAQPGARSPPPTPPRGLGEEKYWELVPMHTYEETHHLTQTQESHDRIDFYAMGRRVDLQRSEEGAQNHLYSEVNLRGLSDRPPTAPLPPPARTAPGLPLRPPPRLPDYPSNLDPAQQRLDGRLPLTPPPQAGPSPSPIYEQIPEGGLSARPPLPPQNPKH